jgi:Zn-dependent protease
MIDPWTSLLIGPSDPASLMRIREAIVMLIALILSIAVHEFGHAFVADKLGDRTPRTQGRVTLNPLVHADPIGTLVFPLVGMFAGGFIFGWGRPVIINPASFTRKLRVKVSHMLVAAAGPAMNVILALLVTVLLVVLVGSGMVDPQSEIGSGIVQVIRLNWILMLFNLIPCPPLDGGAVLAGLLPDRHDHVLDFLNQYGFLIFIGLLVSGVLGALVVTPANWLTVTTLRFALQAVA